MATYPRVSASVDLSAVDLGLDIPVVAASVGSLRVLEAVDRPGELDDLGEE